MVNQTSVSKYIRKWYIRWLRPRIPQEIHRQRVKLFWLMWEYWPILFMRTFSLKNRVKIIARFLRIDWNILSAHHPCEIVSVCRSLADHPARKGEIMIEAGCWMGGSSAKFSIICKMLDYQLHIYDSFEGVEKLSPEIRGNGRDFSGAYAVEESVVCNHIMEYGELSACTTHKGWFADTLAATPVSDPIRVTYIDCDLAKGTQEVLLGVMPGLVEDGWIFSQDFHIKSVRDLLSNPDTWKQFDKGEPTINCVCRNLASLSFRK